MAKSQDKVKSRPRRSIAERLRRYFRGRSNAERQAYLRVRRAIDWRADRQRRSLARDVNTPSFEIRRELGYKPFDAGYFPESAAITSSCIDLVEELGEENIIRENSRKDFMVPFLNAKKLKLHSPILQFALREDILTSITRYFGEVPLLASINAYYSRFSRDAAYSSSQLFHLDSDDVSQIKIFMLCNEVTMEHGPLTVMPADKSSTLRKQVGYRYDQRVSDDDAERIVGNEDRYVFTGAPGSVCMVDTSRCFHYGSRVQDDSKARVVLILQYLHRASFAPPPGDSRGVGAPFMKLAGPDTPAMIRLALGAD